MRGRFDGGGAKLLPDEREEAATSWAGYRVPADSLAGLSWLPRMLQKARRARRRRTDASSTAICYGDNDFIDKQLIAFFAPTTRAISQSCREHPADADVATILVERSGRTPAECAAFDRTFRRKNFDFVFVEADEGRLPPGFKTAAVKFLYNNLVMRIVYPMFGATSENEMRPLERPRR